MSRLPVNPRSPLLVGAHRFRVFEPRVVCCPDAFGGSVCVQLQLVDESNSNHFDVSVWICDVEASAWNPERIWALARALCRTHFSENRYPPRFSSHRFGVQLCWPKPKDYEGTV